MNRIVKTFICMLTLGLVALLGTGAAWANSALTHWNGTASAGAFPDEQNCPLVVEKEVLTFDIQEFPAAYYETSEEAVMYEGSVTASYTVCNPSDSEVKARFFFPFGTAPDYGDKFEDIEKYGVYIDGEQVDSLLRHTYSYFGADFNLQEDLPKLIDGFDDSGFLHPDLPVTEYVYEVSGVDHETYSAACAGFEMADNLDETRIFVDPCRGFGTDYDSFHVKVSAENKRKIRLYVFGNLLKEMPEWKIYESSGSKIEIEGHVTLLEKETRSMDLKEYILEQRPESVSITESDWFNAMVCLLEECTTECGVIGEIFVSPEELPYCLMRWYEYELTVGPGETLINEVKAPLYPSIDEDYNPPVYEYEYLLSPARTWSSFGRIDIIVNTPFYMIESGPEGFEQMEDGYRVRLNEIPEQELTFVLSESPEPYSRYADLRNSRAKHRTFRGLVYALGIVIAIVSNRKIKNK